MYVCVYACKWTDNPIVLVDLCASKRHDNPIVCIYIYMCVCVCVCVSVCVRACVSSAVLTHGHARHLSEHRAHANLRILLWHVFNV
jgi:hypothetical protein